MSNLPDRSFGRGRLIGIESHHPAARAGWRIVWLRLSAHFLVKRCVNCLLQPAPGTRSSQKSRPSCSNYMITAPLINAMTVDVEDYFHVAGFADQFSPDQWADFPSRVVANTHRLLRLMDHHQCLGTYFILGWVADRFPQLVRDIQSAGHEIGCHSYWHRLIYDLTPDVFRQDLQQGCDSIQNITGEPVTLYRAPSFSIMHKSLWAFECLAEFGITADSSVYPVHHDRYGIPDADRAVHTVVTPAGNVDESPGTVASLAGLRLPAGGGGYFRLYLWWLTLHLVRQVTCQRPMMFYIHPWEVDPDQPRLSGSMLSRFRHYQNLKFAEPRLNRLLREFPFDAMSATLAAIPSALPEYRPVRDRYCNPSEPAAQSQHGNDLLAVTQF